VCLPVDRVSVWFNLIAYDVKKFREMGCFGLVEVVEIDHHSSRLVSRGVVYFLAPQIWLDTLSAAG